MAIKEQFEKIKENWLILVLVLVVVLVVSGGSSLFYGLTSSMGGGYSGVRSEMAMDSSYSGISSKMVAPSYYPGVQENFAPEVTDRKITKTTNLATEVARGTFKDSETKLKSIVTSSESFLLNENVYKYDTGVARRSYYSGNYQIKVETGKYDPVIVQLKEIGEVQSFSENSDDITGRYTNLKSELDAEKEKLKRYQQMYDDAIIIADKIDLSDRIANQERTIKYLEDALENMDNRVDYSTIYFTMTEKQSDYANIVFVKFAELVSSFVNSFNNLFRFVFWIIPWAIAVLIVGFVWKRFKKKK